METPDATGEELTTDDQVRRLLEEVKRADETTRDLAFDSLNIYRKECGKQLEWQRTEGRREILLGADPEEIRRRTLERIEAARVRLRDRLTNLLAWAETRPSGDV
jgi:hypothetical protein